MAIVRVKGTGRASLDGSDSVAFSFGSLPSAGNFVAVLGYGWDANVSPSFASAVTDNQGNGTYSQAIESDLINASSGRCFINYKENIAVSGGTYTITVNPAPGTAMYGQLCAIEFSGVATSSSLDKTAQATGGSTTPSSGATATTAQADELILGVHMILDSQGSITAEVLSPIWIPEFEYLLWTSSGPAGEADYRVVSSTAAYTANWTDATSASWAAAIATFKAAAVATAVLTGTVTGSITEADIV